MEYLDHEKVDSADGSGILNLVQPEGISDIAMSRTEEATAFARKAGMYSSSLTFNRHFNFGMYVKHDVLQART